MIDYIFLEEVIQIKESKYEQLEIWKLLAELGIYQKRSVLVEIRNSWNLNKNEQDTRLAIMSTLRRQSKIYPKIKPHKLEYQTKLLYYNFNTILLGIDDRY